MGTIHVRLIQSEKRRWDVEQKIDQINKSVRDTWITPMVADLTTATHGGTNQVVMNDRDLQQLVDYISKKYSR